MIIHFSKASNPPSSCYSIHHFFKSSWWKIGTVASEARNWINFVPLTAATTFAFSSVFILLLWCLPLASVPVLYSTLYSVHCEISQIQRCNFELNYEYFFKNNDFSVGGEEVLVDMRSWDGPVQPKVVAPLAHQTEVESRRLAQLSSSMPTKTAKRRLRLQRRV